MNCNDKGNKHTFTNAPHTDMFVCTICGFEVTGLELMQNGAKPSKMVPSLSAQRLVDEFGFPLPKKEEISVEDLILVKGFLGNLKDQTLSRSTHRVLQDLLQRL